MHLDRVKSLDVYLMKHVIKFSLYQINTNYSQTKPLTILDFLATAIDFCQLQLPSIFQNYFQT